MDEWGSCSKLLVWTSVMQQRERGNIDLDADIREYLPEGFLTKLKYPEEKITMINLMNHNAGFQESFYENEMCSADQLFEDLEQAVRVCECRQAYHVGEYTAYSNWGAALAAYIVERVSGEDYVSYVNNNIFDALGIEHTSIDPLQRDNKWVADKRKELKCYERYSDSSYNKDLGECRSWVQLYPAGAAIGTLEDFTAFARAFVSGECPLFENISTRDEMLCATSFYGDSDIAKSCHGMFTGEYRVQTTGHGGNTGGCTAELAFDPISGLGVTVMAAEPGETAFCYGIPGLIFGSFTDRDEVKNARADSGADISGIYISKRSIVEGAGMASQYMGGVMPLARNGDGSYSVRLFGLELGGAARLYHISDNIYMMDNNGMSVVMYADTAPDGNTRLEMSYMDYVKDPAAAPALLTVIGFLLFGLACIAVLLVKLVLLIVKKARRSDKEYTLADRQITGQQGIYGVSAVIFALLIMIIGSGSPLFTAVSGVLAGILAAASLVNGAVLCYNAFGKRLTAGGRARRIAWGVLGIAYTAFVIAFRLYDFISL